MAKEYTSTGICEQLLKTNQQTFSSGHYQTAYYCLVAALHYARDVGDIAALQAIEHTATEQSEWLETHPQGGAMFSHSMFMRHGIRLYKVLAHQAHVQATLVQRQQHWENNERHGSRRL